MVRSGITERLQQDRSSAPRSLLESNPRNPVQIPIVSTQGGIPSLSLLRRERRPWLCSRPLTAVLTGGGGQGAGLVTNIKRKQIVRLCQNAQNEKQNKTLKILKS